MQVFSRGLSSIIDKLDTPMELEQVLRKMAKMHAKKNIFKNHVMVSFLLDLFLRLHKTHKNILEHANRISGRFEINRN